MHLFGAVVSFLLSSANSKVDQLKTRLQFGYDAADEARSFLEAKKYKEASQSFADALNLGRKPALALQEIQLDDDEEAEEQSLLQPLQEESLEWLVNVCCESSRVHLNHLDDNDNARADAWAACVFSQYQLREPLECMLEVCKAGGDLFGEFQTCQQLLNLPSEEFGDDGEEARKAIQQRLKEIERKLSNK